MSDSQILVSRELLRNVKREVDDLRDERDALLEQLAATGDGADLRAQLDAVRADLTQTQAALADALDEVDRLRAGASSGDSSSYAPAPPRVEAPPETGPAALAATAFVSWCTRNRALVSRPYLFAAFLKGEAGGAEVEVTPVFRDRAMAAPTFRSQTVDGVEHWLVRVGSATVLFPQPLSSAQFRELAPCFDGQATPETLTSVRPARVAAEGGVHVLKEPGRVSAPDA